MSRRIPKAFISELIARADLLDVVGTRVQLKKAGSNYKGLCPFHDEKTPSFTIRPDKGFYKCFGCGAYGNAIDFIMQYENRSFPEAVEILAEGLRLEIPYEGGDAAAAGQHDDLYAVLATADATFREQLRLHEPAIGYLKQRGIDGATAARFGLGFAPDAWDTLSGAARSDPGRTEALVRAGLAARSEGGRVYDRFRNRITFPIRDTRGRVIGFGGRILGDGQPKYLNSPDTPLFDKSRTLYGLYEAREQPGRPETVIVVEGYMDVIALAQAAIGPAIATMGTATTAENTRQLTRLSDRVVFCFDGDKAGRAAAWRALEAVLPYGGGSVEIAFLLLPEGEDPDTFVRSRGAAAFTEQVRAATPLSTFLVSAASAGIGLGHADGKARLIATVRPLLARLARGVYRDLVVAELAEAVGMASASLEQALEAPDRGTTAPPAEAPPAQRKSTAMRQVMNLVLHFPAAAARVGPVDGLDELDMPGAALLRNLLARVESDPRTNAAALVAAFSDDPEGRHLRELAAVDPMGDPDKVTDEIRDGIERFVTKQRKTLADRRLRTDIEMRDRKL